MQAVLEIEPAGPVCATVRPPGSKSITNRALVCAALAAGRSHLSGVLDSDDTRVMLAALRGLGFEIGHDAQCCTVEILGRAGRIPAPGAQLYVANSGTTMRFLTPVVALGQGDFRLYGTPRMHERPIGDLLSALAQWHVSAQAESPGQCPPVVVRAQGLAGGRATVRGDISSQFLSGLLLAAPSAQSPVELCVSGPLVSQPYVRMTLEVMRAFGVAVEEQGLSRFLVPQQAYRAQAYSIEPDASAASYFFAAAAITGGEMRVPGLSSRSLQGDVAFVDVLRQMGCQTQMQADAITVRGGPLVGVTVDMNAVSDTAQTLAVVALFAQGPTTITGVAHIRHKETDRLSAMARELRKLGARVEERQDGLTIHPVPLHPAQLATYDDHRMAMSLALAGLRVPGVRIEDPACTAKTYPGFWEDLRCACGHATS